MSNSQKMSLEERLVQQIKASTLGGMIEEDDLTGLVERAVKEALFQPRRVQVPARYGSGWEHRETDNPVVEAAREAATAIAKRAAEKMMADPGVQAVIIDSMAKMLPAIITDHLRNSLEGVIQSTSQHGVLDLTSKLQAAGVRV